MTDFGGSDKLRDEPSIERVADLYSWAYAWRSQDMVPLAVVIARERAAAKVEAVEDARKLVMQYLVTAEKWRYDEVKEALTRRIAAIRAASIETGERK